MSEGGSETSQLMVVGLRGLPERRNHGMFHGGPNVETHP